jgi:ribonuclease HI
MRIWIDGAGSHMAGQKARYCVIFEDGTEIVKDLPPGTTNNQAEYTGLLAALRDDRSREATIFTDSQLLVGHVTKDWRVNKDHLREPVAQARRFLKERKAVLVWIPRDENRAGKRLERG